MYLKEILDNLRYGELRNTIFSDAIRDETNPNMDMILSAIRHCLEALYLKFPLKHSSVVLDLNSPGSPEQMFDATYAATYNTDFDNDIMYFTKVSSIPEVQLIHRDLEDPTEVPLNDPNDVLSVYTSSPTALVIPQHYFDTVPFLRLDYRATAPPIPSYAESFGIGNSNPWLDIDIQFLPAVVAFVTYKLFAAQDVASSLSISRNGGINFDLACTRIEKYGMYHKLNMVKERPQEGGWE